MTSQDIQYTIIIESGQSGVDANVILCIFGDEETTPNLALRQTKQGVDASFQANNILEFEIDAVNVGKIKKINIGHDGKGSDHQWFLKSVTIKKNDEHYQFEANRWLSDEKDDQKTHVDLVPVEPTSTADQKNDHVTYHITVVTSSHEHAATDSSVFMTIFGDQQNTEQFPLVTTKQGEKASFQTGKTNEFQLDLDDVGQITKIQIGHDGKGNDVKWHLQLVKIEKGTETFNFHANRVLDSTNNMIDLTPTPIENKKATNREATASNTPRHSTAERRRMRTEILYKVAIRTSSSQEDSLNDKTPFYLMFHSRKDQSKKVFLKDGTIDADRSRLKKSEKSYFEFRIDDLGKIEKITLGQDPSKDAPVWHVDYVIIKYANETITFNAERTVAQNAPITLFPSLIPKKPVEVRYKIRLQTGAEQKEVDQNYLLLTMIGSNGKIERIPLNNSNSTARKIQNSDLIEANYKGNDIGKISKIILTQDDNQENIVWHIDHIIIKEAGVNTNFYADKKLEPNGQLELVPSSLPTQSATSCHRLKSFDSMPKSGRNVKDVDYEITIVTGDQSLDAAATLNIRGDNGQVSIPLTKTTTDVKPFQPNATDHFVRRAKDVERIRRIHIEHNENDQTKVWHLKSVQIKKGTVTSNFNANVRLDDKTNKITLYPIGTSASQKEDFVQTELRRLRENLRIESSKLRPPSKKQHEPFVYNDLGPYFDTTAVERAIYSPLDVAPAYYTRVTALRIVEPWEAHSMNFGVNYELVRQRNGRSISAKRPALKSNDTSIDRGHGSTHLPKFPCVSMKKPNEYTRVLTMNDVPQIRSLIRNRCTVQAKDQIKQDYERTRNDFYRMQLDDMQSYHESNRQNMLKIYHAYLENTPGSKKALQELCD